MQVFQFHLIQISVSFRIFSGSVIPAGQGILTNLLVLGSNTCLSDLVLSGTDGTIDSEITNCLTVNYVPPVLPGCTDSLACNYDSSATEDDGSCIYAEENFDCDGNCTVNIDCLGQCGGNALVDECGVCEGAGPQENFDCDGNCLFSVDECGVCNGDGSSCLETTVDIFYNSSIDIGGFQFNVDGVTLVSASGGAAAENGFTLSTSSTVALGFSLTGSLIPAGNGLLTTLTIVGTNICLSGDVVSGYEELQQIQKFQIV